MKRIMIKFTKFFTAAAVVSLVFASCLDDNDDDRLYGEECYGMVEGTGKSFSVKTDGGNTLNVTENLDAKFQAEDGMRVRMNFTVLERKSDSEYDVRANAIGSVLTKKPVRYSELTQQQIDSIGNDPIEVGSAWFGAGKYLNVIFLIWGSNSEKNPHYINLAVDEENSTDDHVIVTLKHNGFGDPRLMQGCGRVSFDIAGLVPAGKKQVNVTLKWIGYDGSMRSDSGVFELKDEQSPTFAGTGVQSQAAKVFYVH